MDAKEIKPERPKRVRSPRTEYQRKWRRENRDKRRAQKRRQYWKDVEATRAAKKAYYEKNNPILLAQARGRRSANRSAVLEKRKEYNVRNPEKLRAWRQNHRKNNRGAYAFQGVQKKCREDGIECDLTPAWIQAKFDYGFCEMSGLPFDMDAKRGPNSPSIDRIDPKGPYTQANCRVILWFINRALSNLGEDYALMVFGEILRRRDMKAAA